MATIVLKYPATCKECGANLEVGDKARYYGRNGIYGIDCHEFKPKFKTFVEMSHPEQAERR